MRNLSLFALAATGLLAAGLLADEPRKGDKSGDERFSDKMFVEKAAVGGMFEVKSSQLAQQMATDPNIKTFAARMVADHTKAHQELMALARQKGWQVPTMLDQKHRDMLDHLSKAQSGQFDKLYVDLQVKAHYKTVAMFEKAAENCQDADLRAWATKTLPTLKEHQQIVKRMASN
jgi:putative membrane protein